MVDRSAVVDRFEALVGGLISVDQFLDLSIEIRLEVERGCWYGESYQIFSRPIALLTIETPDGCLITRDHHGNVRQWITAGARARIREWCKE